MFNAIINTIYDKNEVVFMNIFSALSQGNGRLNEENLTAMLGYILNPHSDHGLSDLFLRRFLKEVGKNSGRDYSEFLKGDYSTDITYESPYEYKGKTRRVDIDLKVFNNDNECLRVLIENKIRATSSDKDQFLEEYLGVCENLDDEGIDNIDVVMVFVTPSEIDSGLSGEYKSLDESLIRQNHIKKWIFWDGFDIENSIVYILKQLLVDEHIMLINPIPEYVRHTIKAFVSYVQGSLTKSNTNLRHKPLKDDSITSSFELWIDDKEYRIEEYSSSAIKVLDLKDDKYVSAKPILRKTIQTLRMPISLENNNGNLKNTRQLGKDVLRYTDAVFKRAMKNDPGSVLIDNETIVK